MGVGGGGDAGELLPRLLLNVIDDDYKEDPEAGSSAIKMALIFLV